MRVLYLYLLPCIKEIVSLPIITTIIITVTTKIVLKLEIQQASRDMCEICTQNEFKHSEHTK
jgi:hypothetical protein